jgi:hypothetical protein
MTLHLDAKVVTAAREAVFGRVLADARAKGKKDEDLPTNLDRNEQLYISCMAGCTHTLTQPKVNDEFDALVRRALLTEMANVNQPVNSRVAMRLLTAKEREAGKVTFNSMGTGKRRTFDFGAVNAAAAVNKVTALAAMKAAKA